MATVFSRIISGEIPSYKVAEDADFYAFLDINPLAAGHTLVVPKFGGCDNDGNGGRAVNNGGEDPCEALKSEIDYIFDLDDRTLSATMVFAKGVAARIKKVTGCGRVAVVVIGMEVPHVHIHLIPINSEGDVDFRKPRVKLLPEEFAALADKLRQA